MEDAERGQDPGHLQFVQDASRDGQAVHVGTDSLQTGRLTQFVTVVVILTPRKGGRVAYRREVVPRITSLRERLLKEVWKSVDLGLQFSPIVNGDLTVHIDANPVVAHKSSAYVQELVGLVVGQGFKALIKPESWAASHAADHVVRAQGKLPSERRRERSAAAAAGRERADTPGPAACVASPRDRRRPFRARVLTKEVSERRAAVARIPPESGFDSRQMASSVGRAPS